PNTPVPESDPPDSSDPFDDAPAVRPAGNSKASSASEPRRMGISPDATPISSRGTAASRKRKNPLSESLELDADDIPDLSADADTGVAVQSEPPGDNDQSGPALIAPGAPTRRRLPAGQVGAGKPLPTKEQRPATNGPRLSAADDSDVDLADDL